jgi:hypothetical protein
MLFVGACLKYFLKDCSQGNRQHIYWLKEVENNRDEVAGEVHCVAFAGHVTSITCKMHRWYKHKQQLCIFENSTSVC